MPEALAAVAKFGTPNARKYLAQLEGVVARHLVRFVFREVLAIAWRRPGAAPISNLRRLAPE